MTSRTIRSLVWRVMEVAYGMILRVRVREGGSDVNYFIFIMKREVCNTLLFIAKLDDLVSQ